MYPKLLISFYSKWTISSRRACALITARRGRGSAKVTLPYSAKGNPSGEFAPEGEAKALILQGVGDVSHESGG